MDGESTEIDGRKLLIQGRLIRVARLNEEWYEDVESPEAMIDAIRNTGVGADVFTFWQRLPHVEARYAYHMERDPIAALSIKSYSHWWEEQIDSAARNKVRKSQKKGIQVRLAAFDDLLVKGITEIFNETPVRQGRHFLHYGKDFQTIKRQFSRYLFREEILAAYLGQELVGFIMLADAGKYAILGQIISKISRRDLAPTNALLAKAVERCAEKGIPYLAYAKWVEGGLGDFKQSNGFQRIDLPRYFVPLTSKGRVFVSLRLYRGSRLLPNVVLRILKAGRRRFHQTWKAGIKHSIESRPASATQSARRTPKALRQGSWQE